MVPVRVLQVPAAPAPMTATDFTSMLAKCILQLQKEPFKLYYLGRHYLFLYVNTILFAGRHVIAGATCRPRRPHSRHRARNCISLSSQSGGGRGVPIGGHPAPNRCTKCGA